MEQFLYFLRDALTTGFSLWSIFLFFQVRRLKKVETISDTRDVWEKIAQSNNDALIRQNNEIRKLRMAMVKVERILYRLATCRHYKHCPGGNELQELERFLQSAANLKPTVEQKGYRYPRDDTFVDNPDGDP